MPTYEYLCTVINEEFEDYHSNTFKLEECLLCKAAGRENHEPKRLISGGGGRGIVQLTGKEYTDQLAVDGLKMRKEIYSSEKMLSNVVGPDLYEKNQRARDKR